MSCGGIEGVAGIGRKLSSSDVIGLLADLFVVRGLSAHIRGDQGLAFIAEAMEGWVAGGGAKTRYIEKARPVPEMDKRQSSWSLCMPGPRPAARSRGWRGAARRHFL
jgi:phage tail tape-measure protein